MNSHEAKVRFDLSAAGLEEVVIDLFPAIPQSYGAVHDAFVEKFDLRATDEIPGLTTMRGVCDAGAFKAFFGASLEEATSRWDALRWMLDVRRESDSEAYGQLDPWILLYGLLERGITPVAVELAFIEHG